jgi:hypothetical protein
MMRGFIRKNRYKQSLFCSKPLATNAEFPMNIRNASTGFGYLRRATRIHYLGVSRVHWPQWLQHNTFLESSTESVNESEEEHDRLTAAEDDNEANSSCESRMSTTIGFPTLLQISTVLPILLDPQQNTRYQCHHTFCARQLTDTAYR